MKKKVIIIGAGPAGITAGYELLEQSSEYDVVILEKSSQVGGISKTVVHNGNRMDIGGHRFFSKDERVNQWWEKVMPTQGVPAYDYKKLDKKATTVPNGPDPDQEDRVMLRRNRVSRIYYKKAFFDYPISMSFSTMRNMGLGTTIVAGFSYMRSMLSKLPDDSLENFYINRFGRKLYSMFFEGYTEKLWGRHPREISADWGAQRVKGLSIKAILKDIFSKMLPTKKENRKVETSLIEEFAYPKFGPGQLWELALADFESKGGEIRLNANVVSIETGEGKLKSVTYQAAPNEKVTIEADIIISSMPVKDLTESIDNVPKDILDIALGLPYRDFVTVGMLLKNINLKNETTIKTLNNIIPDNWVYVQDTGVHLGRIQVFNNWSPYMVKSPESTIWLGLEYFCTEGDASWNMSEEEWKQRAVSELITMGVISSEDVVLDYHCEKVPKAYPAYFDTYKDIDRLKDYLNSYENLYCIGRNGQHRYNNMDHSMETAFQTIDNILSGRQDKSNIWNVNTEEEYHEKK